MQQSKPLAYQFRQKEIHAGEIFVRLIEFRNQAQLCRIASAREYDWNGFGCTLGRQGRRGPSGGCDDRDATLDELGRDADTELAAFRDRMPAEAYQQSRRACIDRLVRERARLPILMFE